MPNRGQMAGSVLFASRARDHALVVRSTGPTLAMAGSDPTGAAAAVALRVRGGRPAGAVRPEGRLPGVVNDYTGGERRRLARWHSTLRAGASA